VDEARAITGIEDVILTAKEGQMLVPLPDGATYLGFLFARGATAADAEQSIRMAHSCLKFYLSEALPVVK
jgi:hypothetical protein